MALEREVKLMLDQEGWARVRRWAVAEGALIQEAEQTNHYFDTDSLGLAEQKLMLRLREKGGAWEATFKVKLKGGPEALGQESVEVNEAIDAAQARALLSGQAPLLDSGLEPVQALRRRAQERGVSLDGLRPIGAMTTLRAKIHSPSRRWVMELDHSRFFGQEDHELECEADDLEAALAEVSGLLDELGVEHHPSASSKSGRFVAALQASRA